MRYKLENFALPNQNHPENYFTWNNWWRWHFFILCKQTIR